MGKHNPGPLAILRAKQMKAAERSAAKANANDDRFASIARGFSPAPDPESLAQIKAAGDAARAAQDARIRAQMQKEER